MSEATAGRPAGSVGDTGLRFSGWYGSAQQTLLFATRDDDPRCVKVLASEAKVAAEMARVAAVNPRQRVAVEYLEDAIDEVYQIAESTPPLEHPHTHDVVSELL